MKVGTGGKRAERLWNVSTRLACPSQLQLEEFPQKGLSIRPVPLESECLPPLQACKWQSGNSTIRHKCYQMVANIMWLRPPDSAPRLSEKSRHGKITPNTMASTAAKRVKTTYWRKCHGNPQPDPSSVSGKASAHETAQIPYLCCLVS